jgi:hypothetical protein
MAEKHKSKYKKPENKKPTYRKDIKDYTMDDKDGKLNPNSTGDKQLNVLRKTDKEVVDNGNLVPKYEADDRLYKDLEDADYDPKTAAKRLKKRQDTEEKEVKDALKDKIENLTREQKERIVREYIRRKIEHVLFEQATPEEEPAPTEEIPADTPPEAPTPEAPMPDAAPMPEVPAPPAEAPAPEAAAEPQLDDATEQALFIQKFVDKIKPDGTVNQVKAIFKVSNALTKDVAPEDAISYYTLLRNTAKEKINRLSNSSKSDIE